MAQKVLVQLVSDMSGTEIAEGDGETVNFALDGKSYELDLTNKEADKFRGVFQNYIAAGRRLGGTSRGTKRTSVAAGGSGMSKEELSNVRSWLRENGHEVNERGRIKQEYIDMYHAAH